MKERGREREGEREGERFVFFCFFCFSCSLVFFLSLSLSVFLFVNNLKQCVNAAVAMRFSSAPLCSLGACSNGGEKNKSKGWSTARVGHIPVLCRGGRRGGLEERARLICCASARSRLPCLVLRGKRR